MEVPRAKKSSSHGFSKKDPAKQRWNWTSRLKSSATIEDKQKLTLNEELPEVSVTNLPQDSTPTIRYRVRRALGPKSLDDDSSAMYSNEVSTDRICALPIKEVIPTVTDNHMATEHDVENITATVGSDLASAVEHGLRLHADTSPDNTDEDSITESCGGQRDKSSHVKNRTKSTRKRKKRRKAAKRFAKQVHPIPLALSCRPHNNIHRPRLTKQRYFAQLLLSKTESSAIETVEFTLEG